LFLFENKKPTNSLHSFTRRRSTLVRASEATESSVGMATESSIVLSTAAARLTLGRVGATGVACAYVAAVRLASGCRRDNVETMRRRFAALTVTCAVAWIPTALLMSTSAVGDADAGATRLTLTWALGLDANRVSDVRACATGALIGIALTLGALVDGATTPNGRLRENLRRIAKPRTRAEAMMNWRDFAHAPACEEFCFRACASSALRVAGASPAEQVWLTAALFALAHAHHYFERRLDGASISRAIAACGIQFAFTAPFGALACVLFRRTQSIVSVILCHVVCNLIGPPARFNARSSRDSIVTALHFLGPAFVLRWAIDGRV